MMKDDGPGAREHRRFPAFIPAQFEIVHAWQGESAAPLTGALYNVSRGGAGARLPRVLPPRTRLRVAIPSAPPGLRLSAEIVWTSSAPGSGKDMAVYGIRWLEGVSAECLGSILPLLPPADPPEVGTSPTPMP
jgi:hypothetical protein